MTAPCLRPLLDPLKRAIRDAPRTVRLLELPGGSALDGQQLLEAIATYAGRLRALGAMPGDCVLVRCSNRLEFPVAVLACWEANASCLLMDGESSEADFLRISGLFHPVAALGCPPGAGSGPETGLKAWKLEPGTDSAPSLPADTALMKLTSGTQGHPRGVVLTLPQVMAGARQILETMDIRPTDTNIAAIPMSHSYGFDNLLLPLAQQGSPLVVLSEVSPVVLTQALAMKEPCIFPGVPYLFDLLCRIDWSRPPTGLRLCLSAGAPLSKATSLAFQKRHGRFIHSFYGATEAGGISYETEESFEFAEGSVGRPMGGVEIEFERPEGMPSASKGGRIIVKSPAVASQYWPAEESPSLLGSGRFVTGDIGRLDAGGRLRLEGRLGFLINVAGRKVNPQEVERAIRSLPGVRDAAVVAVPDARRGQALGACVASVEGPDRQSLLEALGARLARYKLPRRMLVVRDLPRTSRGKPDLARIRRMLEKP